jgi:hypothetical protein
MNELQFETRIPVANLVMALIDEMDDCFLIPNDYSTCTGRWVQVQIFLPGTVIWVRCSHEDVADLVRRVDAKARQIEQVH